MALEEKREQRIRRAEWRKREKKRLQEAELKLNEIKKKLKE